MTESAQTLTIGKYENKLGAVLEITGNYLPRPGEPKVLSSDIYEAVARNTLFGNTYYLVTAHSMTQAGYKKVNTDD